MTNQQAPATDRAGLLRRLRQGDVEADQLLTGTTPRHLTAVPVAGGWSVRDVIAHCIAHEQFALDELRAVLGEAPRTVDYRDADSFNAGAAAAMRSLEPRIVVAGWRTSRREVIAFVERLPDDAFDPSGTVAARLGDTIDGALANNTYEHWAAHLAEIRQALAGDLA